MRLIAIDTNIYISFKYNDESVVEAFRDCDLIGVDITIIHFEEIEGLLLLSAKN